MDLGEAGRVPESSEPNEPTEPIELAGLSALSELSELRALALRLTAPEDAEDLAHDAVRHEVVVGPPRGDQPGARPRPREPSLEEEVGVRDAEGCRPWVHTR